MSISSDMMSRNAKQRLSYVKSTYTHHMFVTLCLIHINTHTHQWSSLVYDLKIGDIFSCYNSPSLLCGLAPVFAGSTLRCSWKSLIDYRWRKNSVPRQHVFNSFTPGRSKVWKYKDINMHAVLIREYFFKIF